MSPQESYQDLKPQFSQLTPEQYIKRLNTPAATIADGNAQLVVARQDLEKLTAEGMPTALITDVEKALHAFSWVSSLHDTAIMEAETTSDLWAATKERAYELRKDLFKYGAFGCKKNNFSEVLIELNELREGTGDDDMIYDLLGLHQLFTKYPTVCNGLTTFNISWVNEALTLHTKLSELKAEVKNPDESSAIEIYEKEAKQAYTHYHKKLYELRDWGEFVFEGEERYTKYQSLFRRKN